MTSIDRRRYAELYGPTVGDRVRLGDTDLWISPTEDRCSPSGPGDETVFGGGKVIRESMGQATFSTVDLVITNAVVLDHWGVVKADVGVRDGVRVHCPRSLRGTQAGPRRGDQACDDGPGFWMIPPRVCRTSPLTITVCARPRTSHPP